MTGPSVQLDWIDSKDLFAGVAADVPVIDTSNYYPILRDGRIPELETGDLTESEAEMTDKLLSTRVPRFLPATTPSGIAMQTAISIAANASAIAANAPALSSSASRRAEDRHSHAAHKTGSKTRSRTSG